MLNRQQLMRSRADDRTVRHDVDVEPGHARTVQADIVVGVATDSENLSGGDQDRRAGPGVVREPVEVMHGKPSGRIQFLAVSKSTAQHPRI